MPDRPLVVGIGGSTRPTSVTSLLLHGAMQRIEERGAQVRTFDGTELAQLPIFTLDGAEADPVAETLADTVRRADAVVIATPGYHGGMSGLVKNAVDHLDVLRADERPYLDGRAVAVIVAAAGWQACGTALVSVRSTIHSLRGWPTPFGVTVNSVEQTPDDARVGGALDVLAEQVMRFVSWQATARIGKS